MRVASCIVLAAELATARLVTPNNAAECNLHATFADMHDGDKKHIDIKGSAVVITSASGGSWEVNTRIDCASGNMMVDFDVPGKADHPPVPLQATLWETSSIQSSKTVVEFIDPSGTLGDPAKPLNQWVDIGAQAAPASWVKCPTALRAVFADMHDGDMKEVTIEGSSLMITPSGNNQVWELKTVLDSNCQAVVDFKDSGKPAYPPVNLTATFWQAKNQASFKAIFEFTDPSGTLADPDAPLNHWVQLEPVV